MLDAFSYTVVFDVLEKYAENNKAQFHYSNDPRAWANAKKHDKMGTDALCIPRSPEGEAWQWHMVDVRDVVNVVEECLENENAFGKTFNIAGADVCDWSKLVPYIGEKTGRKIVEIEIPNVWQYSFDQSALKNDLGFSSNFDHFQMIDAALAMSNNEDVGIIQGDAFTY
jgi:nucleoside-diphosphate-sugar epimerase